MAVIHLMVGFIGFGKTTLAKKIAEKEPAVLFTHDDIMLARYGRNPDDFGAKYKIVDDFIREETAKHIKQGQNVILDYGFWSHAKREEYYNWAKTLTENVIFHNVCCDLKTAKERVLNRTKNDTNALWIDENMFDTLLKQYEAWGAADDYPVIFHNAPVA